MPAPDRRIRLHIASGPSQGQAVQSECRCLLPLPSNAKVVADVAAAIKRFFDLDGEPALTVGGYAVLPELPASIFRDDDEVHVTVAPASHPARRNPRQQSTPVAQGAQRRTALAATPGAPHPLPAPRPGGTEARPNRASGKAVASDVNAGLVSSSSSESGTSSRKGAGHVGSPASSSKSPSSSSLASDTFSADASSSSASSSETSSPASSSFDTTSSDASSDTSSTLASLSEAPFASPSPSEALPDTQGPSGGNEEDAGSSSTDTSGPPAARGSEKPGGPEGPDGGESAAKKGSSRNARRKAAKRRLRRLGVLPPKKKVWRPAKDRTNVAAAGGLEPAATKEPSLPAKKLPAAREEEEDRASPGQGPEVAARPTDVVVPDHTIAPNGKRRRAVPDRAPDHVREDAHAMSSPSPGRAPNERTMAGVVATDNGGGRADLQGGSPAHLALVAEAVASLASSGLEPQGMPPAGTFLAYRVLEMGPDLCPTVSEYRLGTLVECDAAANTVALAPHPMAPHAGLRGAQDGTADSNGGGEGDDKDGGVGCTRRQRVRLEAESLYDADGVLRVAMGALQGVRMVSEEALAGALRGREAVGTEGEGSGRAPVPAALGVARGPPSKRTAESSQGPSQGQPLDPRMLAANVLLLRARRAALVGALAQSPTGAPTAAVASMEGLPGPPLRGPTAFQHPAVGSPAPVQTAPHGAASQSQDGSGSAAKGSRGGVSAQAQPATTPGPEPQSGGAVTSPAPQAGNSATGDPPEVEVPMAAVGPTDAQSEGGHGSGSVEAGERNGSAGGRGEGGAQGGRGRGRGRGPRPRPGVRRAAVGALLASLRAMQDPVLAPID